MFYVIKKYVWIFERKSLKSGSSSWNLILCVNKSNTSAVFAKENGSFSQIMNGTDPRTDIGQILIHIYIFVLIHTKGL